MHKLAIVSVIVVLSFFINLLYYVAWMLMDQWLVVSDEADEKKISTVATATTSTIAATST